MLFSQLGMAATAKSPESTRTVEEANPGPLGALLALLIVKIILNHGARFRCPDGDASFKIKQN
jgi:hypothetical protein